MEYIGAHSVNALHKYKYSGVDHSYVAKYALQPFWTRFVMFFPLWMPPNMITLTGFMFLLTSVLLGYTFDAVDGKQARRTNSSSLLGELFDHARSIGCWKHYIVWWTYFLVLGDFSDSILLCYVGQGPTEGLMLIYLSHCFTSIVGSEWWAQPFGKSLSFLSWVPFLSEITMSNAMLLLMLTFVVVPTVTFNIMNVCKVVQEKRGSMLWALAMLYPFAVLLGSVLAWAYLSPSDIVTNYPHMVVMGTELAFGYLVGRMILVHLCDEPKGLKTGICMSLLYLPFAIANSLTARLNDGVPLVDDSLV